MTPESDQARFPLVRGLGLVALVLAVPILPFLLAGPWLEGRIASSLKAGLAPAPTVLVVVGVLAGDLLLPVPSSLVSTWAGARLGVGLGTAAVWLGMMAGATIGFAAGRAGGRSLVARWIDPADRTRLQHVAKAQGWWLLIVTRPLPVLAEAAVLLCGALQVGWTTFWLATAPVSLAVALAYCILGQKAQSGAWMSIALPASVAIPLAMTWLARQTLGKM